MVRIAVYFDGFNLYHAIDELKRPHLKWVDLSALAHSMCREGEDLVKTAYFSAYATWMPDAYSRHRAYVRALESRAVDCHMARFSEKRAHCKACGSHWTTHEEKETDVHFSLTLLEDAIDGVFDRAIIVSADSDHAPAVRRVLFRHPEKRILVATPPGRRARARELIKAGRSTLEITQGRLARCLLPRLIYDKAGAIIASRPPSYDPPPGWLPPD